MMQGPTQQKNVLRQVLLWNLALVDFHAKLSRDFHPKLSHPVVG